MPEKTLLQQSYTTADKLRIEAQRYIGGDRVPVICISGLTRNLRDFETLAPQIAAQGRDVLSISLRGRAGSDYDPVYQNYHPMTYRDDILAVMDQAEIGRAVFVGTSLGGIVTMLVSQAANEKIAGAVLNDIGPELDPEGLARIGGYVGSNKTYDTLADAAAALKAVHHASHPDEPEEFWLDFAYRTFVQNADGQYAPDYDLNIAKALGEVGPGADLWPAFRSLESAPLLLVHGGLSDLLTMPIVEKMHDAMPAMVYAAAPRVGHAPTMSEPTVLDDLLSFIDGID